MAIPDNRTDKEFQKFVESTTVANLPAVAVVNPNGTNISATSTPRSISLNETTGSGAISINLAPGASAQWKILSVTCHFSAAPTTSENFVIKKSNSTAAYTTEILSVDPSASTATDIAYIPDGELIILGTTEDLDITFTNTETRTYGVTVTYEVL
tara:strand:+ start:720 stop:1184 length:465 start_codon:yes stop_codon:yes gene_type:complete